MDEKGLNFDPATLNAGYSMRMTGADRWRYTMRHATLGIEGQGATFEDAVADMAAKVRADGREIVIPPIGWSDVNVELGNLLFGNSRGEFAVPRSCGYENELQRLLDAIGTTDWGDIPIFENDTFAVRPYWWGDCKCSEDAICSCEASLPNFHHKPSGFRLDWYKYPLRDSYANQPLTIYQFAALIDACIESMSA